MSRKARNYLRRTLQPQYWPELGRLAARRLKRTPRPEGALELCAASAVPVATAVAALGFDPDGLRSFAADHPDRLKEAQARVTGANGRMGGGADVDLLYSLCRIVGARTVLETGVAFGWSSLAILSALEGQEKGRLVSVDLPYLGSDLDALVGLAVPEGLREGWALLRGADREQLPRALKAGRPFDLAHYDSDKSYAGRRWAYPLMLDAIAPGGLLVSDDVQDNLAFFDFCQERGLDPVVVRASAEEKYVGIIRK